MLEDLKARISRGHGLSHLYSFGNSSEPEESSEEEQLGELDDNRNERKQLDVDLYYGEQSKKTILIPDDPTPFGASATRSLAQCAPPSESSADSPVQLIIADLPFDVREPKLAVISEVLQQLQHNYEFQPSIDWRRLILSEEPGPGYISTRIRLSWSEDKLMDDANLVDEMNAVRQALQDSGYRVFWANAPIDLRNVSDVEMSDDSGSAQPALECRSFKWLYDQCVRAGVEPVDASGGRSCPRYHKYRLTFRTHSDPDTLEAYLRSEKLLYRGEPVLFHRPQIAVSYPTNIGSPGRGNMSTSYLLAEIEGWVTAYNSKRSTRECLLHMEGGKSWEMVQGVFIVKPSSMHLAEFLARQIPRCGPKYELLYRLNSRIHKAADASPSFKRQLEKISKDLSHVQNTVCRVIPNFWAGGEASDNSWDLEFGHHHGTEAESSWSSEAEHLLDP